MKKLLTLMLSLIFLASCGKADKKNAPGPAGGPVILNGTAYKPDIVIPTIIKPPGRGLAVFYAETPCDVTVDIFLMDGTLKQHYAFKNISGKNGVYISSEGYFTGLYICKISYSRGGKKLKELVTKFIICKNCGDKDK